MKQKIALALVLALWLGLAAFAWVKPPAESSDSERRPLAQMPELDTGSLTSGEFMTGFADYAVDQFPLRDAFRTLNALTGMALGKTDNNGIYLHDGYAAKMEYPLDESALEYAIDRFNDLYEMYLTDADRILFAVAPEKGYFLAEDAGVLGLDYDRLFSMLEEGLPWAEHIDLTGALSIDSYYRTDTHWRQEALLPAAKLLTDALGVSLPEFTRQTLERPFYGVYYGQAALPMKADELRYLTNETLENCTVYCHDNGLGSQVYDMTKLQSKDLYDVFLSGGAAVLEIRNPAGQSGRELIVFRDSFGSSMVPLLLADYETVWVLDTRYVNPSLLSRFVEFGNQDVLLLYSPLVLNASGILRK